MSLSYESWRISFQSDEQAARAAFNELQKIKGMQTSEHHHPCLKCEVVIDYKDSPEKCPSCGVEIFYLKGGKK